MHEATGGEEPSMHATCNRESASRLAPRPMEV